MDELIERLTTVEVTVPAGLPQAEMDLICDWTRQHGVDPNEVPLPCTLLFQRGQVTFPKFVRGQDGRKRLRHGDAERTTVTVPQQYAWPYEGSPRAPRG